MFTVFLKQGQKVHTIYFLEQGLRDYITIMFWVHCGEGGMDDNLLRFSLIFLTSSAQ